MDPAFEQTGALILSAILGVKSSDEGEKISFFFLAKKLNIRETELEETKEILRAIWNKDHRTGC